MRFTCICHICKHLFATEIIYHASLAKLLIEQYENANVVTFINLSHLSWLMGMTCCKNSSRTNVKLNTAGRSS